MKRREVVVQGGARTAQPKGKPSDLCRTPIETIARQTYLSTVDACVYLRFDTFNGFYKWVERHGVPRCRRGRVVLFLRRDLDRMVQGTTTVADLAQERAQSHRRGRG